MGTAASVVLPLVPVWPCVLFEHFRLQYLVAGALVTAAVAGLRLRGWFDAALVATIVNACWVLPDLSRNARDLPAGTPVRVLLLNVHTSSSSFADVTRLVGDVKPDVLALLEVDARWLAALAPTTARFAHRIEDPRDDNFGIALYTHAPLTGAAEPVGSPLPTIVATLALPHGSVDVVLTHPIPPIRPALHASQLSQLEAIAHRVRTFRSPVIVMGDLNATPWSRPFRDLVASTGLCDTRAGFGLQASFPASSVAMRIPIDHVLVSCSVGVRDRTIGLDVGSDHLPVVVDLVVP